MTAVCILLQNFYDIDIRVRRKAEALAAAGYSVDVFALSSPKYPKNYTLEGVNVYTISLGKLRGSLMRYAFEYIAFLLWCLFRTTVRMHRRRYAVIDVNTLPDFLVFAPVFAKWMGAKIVLDMHEITPEFYMSKYGMAPDSLSVRLLKFQEKISFDFADHVIAINQPILDLLCGRGLDRARTSIIMNSADEARFTSSSTSVRADAMADDKFVMMYHGTLTNLYGLDLAIEAFALVHKEMAAAELWILGSGPEKTALESLAQERGIASKVRFVGQVPPSEIPMWLSQCKVGILPIRRDVFLEFASPNKLPEFIIMGKPVIISRLKAIRFYFCSDALAFFEPNDPTDLASQMVRLYQDRDLRVRLVDRAKKDYEPIRWDVMKQRYLRMMEDLTGFAGRGQEQLRVAAAAAASRSADSKNYAEKN